MEYKDTSQTPPSPQSWVHHQERLVLLLGSGATVAAGVTGLPKTAQTANWDGSTDQPINRSTQPFLWCF